GGVRPPLEKMMPLLDKLREQYGVGGFAPIFPDTCYHLIHYWPAAVDIPVVSFILRSLKLKLSNRLLNVAIQLEQQSTIAIIISIFCFILF
ncbi:hypothetical protein FW382_25355, partial [Escherichia coli]|nr:hypothetical protein [Escherichia coli]